MVAAVIEFDPTLVVVDVPLALIDAAPADLNSRAATDDVTELAASLAELGLLQPVGVRRAGARYTLVYGHRRVAAARKLGWNEISAVLVDAPPQEDLLRSLVENVQRRQLSRAERAAALERLLTSGLTARSIAQSSGLNENMVAAWMRVARSPVLLEALRSEQVGIHEARMLSTLPDPTARKVVADLQGHPERWRKARIQRAIDAMGRTPRGHYAKLAETKGQRALELILELMRGVREIRSSTEISLLEEICALADGWKASVTRARKAQAVRWSCGMCGTESTTPPPAGKQICPRCGSSWWTPIATRAIEARAI